MREEGGKFVRNVRISDRLTFLKRNSLMAMIKKTSHQVMH